MPSDVPTGWPHAALADIADSQPNAIVDGPFGSNLKTSDYVDHGVPVLQGGNITGNSFTWGGVRFLRATKAKELARSSVRVGDILTVKIGSIGYSAIVGDLHGHDHAIIPANLLKVTLNALVADTRYVHQYLTSQEGADRLRRLAGSTAQPALSLKTIRRFTVPLPPLPEQKKIAAILCSVDEVIQATQAVIDRTRRVKEGLLQDLLTRGIGHIRLKGTPIGKVPVDWEVMPLECLAEIRSGLAKNASRTLVDPVEVAYLRVANVQDGYLDLTHVSTIEVERAEVERFALAVGDVLMNEGGDIDKLGRGDVWSGQIAPCINQNHVFAVRCGPRLQPRYLAYLAESPYGKAYFLRAGKQSTNLASINKGQLRSLPIPLPPQSEQLAILAHLDATRFHLEALGRTIIAHQRVKEGLLQDLLTGRVRVPV